MLKISSLQTTQLDRVAEKRSKAQLVDDLRAFGPEISNAAGEEALVRFVDLGCDQAVSYGFNQYGSTRLYLQLMMSFGSGFNTDSQLPWASAILEDAAIPDQLIRANRLYRSAENYRRAVIGDDFGLLDKALSHADAVFEAIPSASGDAGKWLAPRLRDAYPEKMAYISDDGFGLLIVTGEQQARHIGGDPAPSTCLCATLMFVFGHAVFDDPLYPWVAGTLAAENEPVRRLERLSSKANIYLAGMANSFPGKGI